MKINPRQMERMMKQMGMQMSNIDAEEVIIRTKDRDIVITDPEVSKVNVMGQDTFQISGNVEEKERDKFSEEDIEMVEEQTGASRDEAVAALNESGDLAGAIMRLKSRK